MTKSQTNQSLSTILQTVAFGLSSGIGFAAVANLLASKRRASDLDGSTNWRKAMQRTLSNLKRRLHKPVDWSTILVIYTLKQTRANSLKHNLLALPLLYFLIDNGDEGNEDEIEDDPQDDSKNNEHENAGSDKDFKGETATTAAAKETAASNQNQPQQGEEEKRLRSSSVHTQTSEGDGSIRSGATKRYLEMCLHNVSHTDLVLGLGIPEECQKKSSMFSTTPVTIDEHDLSTMLSHETPRRRNKKEETNAHALCRPRFSTFDVYCRRILHILKRYKDTSTGENQEASDGNSGEEQERLRALYAAIMSFPKYERSDSTPRFSLVTPKPSRQNNLPVGFNLAQLVREAKEIEGGGKEELKMSEDDLASLRMRGRDMVKMEGLMKAGYSWPPSPLMWRSNDQEELREVESDDGRTESVTSPDQAQQQKMITPLYLESIFFPLLSSLLRRWHAQITDKYEISGTKNVKKVLILVTGVGTPRNWTHSISGNSTKACAELMEMFINVLYPDVVVVRLHSEKEIFRYDENINFANKELRPCVDAYRDAHARGERYPDEVSDSDLTTVSSSTNQFDPDWKQTFSVTLSFADGAPARTHAIQTALRPYHPTYFHFWQLKTFWHDSKICDDDIEVHSFESMETVPATEVTKTHSNVQMVVKEMRMFRQQFIRTLNEGENDIRKFWLRKTKKPVLAVLLVKCPEKGLITYRGTNMEVSMPTGSLCAERNVIGTALATNPSLRRENLIMVAVLALPLPSEDTPSPSSMPSPPSGYSPNICSIIYPKQDNSESLDKKEVEASSFFSEVEEKLTHYQRPENIRRSMSIGSFASIIECSDDSHESDDSWVVHDESKKIINKTPFGSSNEGGSTLDSAPTTVTVPPLQLPTSELISEIEEKFESSLPMRKIKLYHGDIDAGANKESTDLSGTNKKLRPNTFRRKKKRTILVHSPEDINPLRPCGACNEWLKKIAESNPYFKVITFTDADCNGVYVTPCQE